MAGQPSRQQLSEQARAQQAWKDVEQVKKGIQDKYGTLARKLTSLLQVNGLGQTLAFLLAKAGNEKGNAHYVLYRHVSDWVMGQMNPSEERMLLDWIIRQRSDLYRRATVEALAYAMWLRRFVEAKGFGDATGGD
jgi:CRISPR-associated protein Cmr5